MTARRAAVGGILCAVAIVMLTIPSFTGMLITPVCGAILCVHLCMVSGGMRLGALSYIVVSLLGVLLMTSPAAFILFVSFGSFPMLKRLTGRIANRVVRWVAVYIIFNVMLITVVYVFAFVMNDDSYFRLLGNLFFVVGAAQLALPVFDAFLNTAARVFEDRLGRYL